MKSNLIAYWVKAKHQINARSLRERALLLLTGLVVIWVMMFHANDTPKDTIEDIGNLEQEVSATKQELEVLKMKLQKQENPGSNEQIKQLKNSLDEHNNRLNHYREKLIKPELVPLMFEKLFSDFSGLTLVDVQTLSPKELVQVNVKAKNETALYRHAIRLTFDGEYINLVNYLKMIERLEYPLWWDEIEYKITTFPKARIVLTVYTLSEHSNWIGV